MSTDEMKQKILRYAHRPELEHLTEGNRLERAVEERRYIFDGSVKFDIQELTHFRPGVQPKSLDVLAPDYPELFSPAWHGQPRNQPELH